jgi:hypothetical protein
MVGPPPESTQVPVLSITLLNKYKEVQAMWAEATRVAVIGFSVVFITLWILAASVKVMTFFCRMVDKKGGKKK